MLERHGKILISKSYLIDYLPVCCVLRIVNSFCSIDMREKRGGGADSA